MRRSSRWTSVVGATASLALTLGGTAGCGKSATPGSAATGSSPGSGGIGAATTAPAPTTTAPSPSASQTLADGRSAVYLTGLDVTKNTVTFDLIDFLTGDQAKAEWKKEHPENPDGPDNDYMIINNNKMLRTLPVAAGTQCLVLSTLGGTDTKTIGFAAFPAFLKQQNKGMTLTPPDIAMLPFWLTVQHGTVTRFEEQFLP